MRQRFSTIINYFIYIFFDITIEIQEVLNRGTAEEIADETKRLIDILGEDGGYVFGPGHTYIQPDVPIENIIVMYDTAVNYR